MRIKLNTIFFSCFFTAVLLAELYCLFVLEANLFTIGGLGVVVLISLYLLLDSARSQWKKGKEKTLLYLEQLYREETEKRDQRFTELLNLQKASYTSVKKNAARLEEKLLQLHSLGQSNTEMLKRVAEYQKKLMEGQKNSLNIEVNYNKANTKAIITAIREEADRLNHEDKLEQILKAFQGLQGISRGVLEDDAHLSEAAEEEFWEDELPEELPDTDRKELYEEELSDTDRKELYEEELLDTDRKELYEEELPNTDRKELYEEDLTEEGVLEETPVSTISPLYEDPNKSLTADEIASLFASYGR